MQNVIVVQVTIKNINTRCYYNIKIRDLSVKMIDLANVRCDATFFLNRVDGFSQQHDAFEPLGREGAVMGSRGGATCLNRRGAKAQK